MRTAVLVSGLLGLGLATSVPRQSSTQLKPGPNPACPSPWRQINGKDACFDCCNWARLGQCDSNPNWMRPYCQESCGTTGCKIGAASSCKVKVKSICGGTQATPTKPGSSSSSPGQQIVLNLLIKPTGKAAAAKPTAAKPTTAKPKTAVGPGARLLIIPLNLAGVAPKTGAAAKGAAATKPTTPKPTTPKPRKVNLANLPVYVLQLKGALPGLKNLAAAATAKPTTKKPVVAAAAAANLLKGINLANLQKLNIPVAVLTPAQRRARAMRRLVAKRRRAMRLRQARLNQN